MKIEGTGLILEGGGLRGAFTTGVLDAFMEYEIQFPYTIGVSAGANNGMSYMANQLGRSFYCNILLLKKYNYVGLRHFITGYGYINLQYLIRDYPEKYMPLDFEAIKNSKDRFIMVTSNCITGEPVYFEEQTSKERLLDICQASCSLPILCPEKSIDGIPMLDGGVCDSIPVCHAREDGFLKNVVILTKTKGYRKPNKKFYFPKFLLHKYPRLRHQLTMRYISYNEILDYVDELENKGHAYVIRPTGKMKVSRTTTDYYLLKELYEEGRMEGEKFIHDMGLVSRFNERGYMSESYSFKRGTR